MLELISFSIIGGDNGDTIIEVRNTVPSIRKFLESQDTDQYLNMRSMIHNATQNVNKAYHDKLEHTTHKE